MKEVIARVVLLLAANKSAAFFKESSTIIKLRRRLKLYIAPVKINRYASIIISLTFCFISCQNKEPKSWSGMKELRLELAKDATLKCHFNVVDSFHFQVLNNEEVIDITEISYQKDSLFFVMPVFGTEFKGKLSEGTVKGHWYNYLKSSDYQIPFNIIEEKKTGINSRLSAVNGRYACWFYEENGDSSPAIGLFKTENDEVVGSFLTETGDYRYLTGSAKGNTVEWSTFDGSHAFHFRAEVKENGELKGTFRSGTHWFQTWKGQKSQESHLRDYKQLTYLKEGYDNLSFRMRQLDGTWYDTQDSTIHKGPMIIQLMGTWCPNCMDESRFLNQMHAKYHEQGLNILALDFEPDTSFAYFQKRARRYQKDLSIPYPILLAGNSNKSKARESLPMLNKVISYPTAIFLNKQGAIVEIHTGFTGPGTGKNYDRYTDETERLIQTLLE